MLKRLFEKQKALLDDFYARLDVEGCEQVFEMIKGCEGTLFLTGVGKSGFVAQKVAATLLSTGTKALYLPPIDALHGDLGMVQEGDLLLLFSKSGETEELLQLLSAVENKGVQTIAITSNAHSRLVKEANLFVELPCSSELCPFDLSPTISSSVQLLFGDVIAIALMEAKGFSLEQFARNHPAGRIGRRATLKVKDLMLSVEKAPLCQLQDRLEGVLKDFTDKRCGCLVVTDEKQHLQGIFTDGDLRRALQTKGEQVLKEAMQTIMTPAPRAIDSDSLAWDALKDMEADPEHPVTVLPVTKKGTVIGLIKLHDIIQAGI